MNQKLTLLLITMFALATIFYNQETILEQQNTNLSMNDFSHLAFASNSNDSLKTIKTNTLPCGVAVNPNKNLVYFADQFRLLVFC